MQRDIFLLQGKIPNRLDQIKHEETFHKDREVAHERYQIVQMKLSKRRCVVEVLAKNVETSTKCCGFAFQGVDFCSEFAKFVG